MDQAQRLAAVKQRIGAAERQAGRDAGSVRLIAVGKTFPAADIRAFYALGQRDFGENYIREWQLKAEALADCAGLVWHIIGHVQSNKSRPVAEGAHWLHTLDSAKLARRLSDQRPPQLPDLQVCIEINISGEAAKHGVAPEQMLPLAREVAQLPRLNLRGLMCVAEATDNHAALRAQFDAMRNLLVELQTVAPQADTLSMGMSGDLETAVACGATMVRIGSALFGRRDYGASENG